MYNSFYQMATLSPPSEAITRLKDIHLRMQMFTNPPTHMMIRNNHFPQIIVETDVFIQIKRAQLEVEKAIQMLNEKTTTPNKNIRYEPSIGDII